MYVAVVVPFAGRCPHRARAWEWIRGLYAERHPDWQVITAGAVGEVWCKARAVNPAVNRCEAEIIILADADVWTDGLQAAVDAVSGGAPWAVPHLLVHRLSEDGTEAVLGGADWREQPLTQPPYKGIEGGGVVVASREVIEEVPLDQGFVGWGQEDECHAHALRTIVGKPWRGSADLLHLFHPPQPRMTRRRGSQQSWELRKRYFAANDPCAMRALIEESRDASQPSQHSRDDHPAVGVG